MTANTFLKKLLEGNKNFAESKSNAKNRNFDKLKDTLCKGQSPYAAILGCSDSRVAPEIIFDTGLGELFTVRTAGSTVGPNVLESIEYAVWGLKVGLLVILTHQNCGVMKRVFEDESDFPNLTTDAVNLKHQSKILCCNELAKNYTQTVKEKLLEKSKIIKNAYSKGELEIVKAYFSLETGLVQIIN